MRRFIVSILAAAVCGCSVKPPEPPAAPAIGTQAAEAVATPPPAPPADREEHQVESKPRESPHAMKLIRLGDNLLAAGKVPNAIAFYRDAVKKHPGTVQAGKASSKILALGGKIPEASECEELGEPKPEAPHVRKRAPTPHTAEAPPPEAVVSVPSSSRGSSVHTGPRGGVFHYSKNGKKVYHSRK